MTEYKRSGESRYTLKNEVLNQKIEELVKAAGISENDDLFAEILTTSLKLAEDKVERGDLKILNTSLKELRWAFKVFRPYRHIRKVDIFGSARIPSKDPVYQTAKKFGQLMAESGWMVITGASSGIMNAGNEGAGKHFSFGANIRLPFEQTINPIIIGDHKLINFKYFFARKLIFIKESDAICLFPGGFGTLDEGFEALTLVQTGKSPLRPIVMIEHPKYPYWKPFLGLIKRYMLKRKMISPSDMNLFHLAKTPEEARDVILKFYRNYHSQRYVRDHLVIRMKKQISKNDLAKLNREFKDILLEGKIETSSALPEEVNEEDISSLPRLVLKFDRKNLGRLKMMIDRLNDMGE